MFFLRKIVGAVLGIMGAPILFVACTLLYVTGGHETTAVYLRPNLFIEMHPRTFLALGAGVAMLVASWWLLRDPKRRDSPSRQTRFAPGFRRTDRR